MDIFKILTRRTNIQRDEKANGLSKQNLPSAGARTHPQSVGELGQVTRGIKRKRQGNEASQFQIPGDEHDHPSGSLPASEHESGGTTARQEKDGDASLPGGKATVWLSEEEIRKTHKAHKLKISLMKKSSEDGPTFSQISPQPLVTFQQLQNNYAVSRRIVENIRDQNFATLTDVQIGTIPILLGDGARYGLRNDSRENRAGQGAEDGNRRLEVDLMTVAPTGSGKTLAFLIPLFHRLMRDEKINHGQPAVRGVVLAPTHELVDQIVNEGRKFAKGTGLHVTVLRKGMHIFQHDSSGVGAETSDPTFLKADVVVSTPMTLLNALRLGEAESAMSLPDITSLVFDEADVLLDPLFREQTLAVWKSCPNPHLRVSFWSATIGASIETLVQSTILDRRTALALRSRDHHIIRVIVGLKDSALPTISHRLIYAATEQGKLLGLRRILHPTSVEAIRSVEALRPPFLVFTQTIERAVALRSELRYDIPVEAGGSSRIAVLHSDLSDAARSKIMSGFRAGEIWIIITTDLLSRGIDFRGVNGVINFDIPNTAAAYVHRAGRTGRAGREGGMAVTLYTKEDIPYMKNIANVITASERASGKDPGKRMDGEGVPRWLLDSLPSLSKKTKKVLKKRGVESRRPGHGDSKSRISTKSGYDRQRENRKKGAVEGSRRRQARHEDEGGSSDGSASAGEWSGFGD